MSEKFNILPLKIELLENLNDLKFDSMTPIQKKSLPIVLQGRDIIAQAKTGSGKTAAFGLGILNSLNTDELKIQSLILCPTRELAEQVAKEIRMLARKLQNVKVLTLCGGVAQYHQEVSLSHGVHLVVGTPGRVLRLLKDDLLNLENVTSFVLDEADRMLDMGFINDIKEIEFSVPDKRQSMLFSATFPDEILKLSEEIQTNASIVKVDTSHEKTSIVQKFYEVEGHGDKKEALLKILAKYKPDRFLVFCKMKQIADDVAKLLNNAGIQAAAIHGDLDQNERTSVLTKFSNKSISALVATDVAARGLDITDLAAVMNYDLPTDPQNYIHRIGRTGRAGKSGQAFSVFMNKEGYKIDAIEEELGMKFEISDLSKYSDDDIYDLVPPMKTIYISGGKKDKLRPGDIVGAIVGEAQVDASVVGDISILSVHSLVAIREEFVKDVIGKLNAGKIKNRKFKVGLA
jgi:ATP-independent RNA helicase DbpA